MFCLALLLCFLSTWLIQVALCVNYAWLMSAVNELFDNTKHWYPFFHPLSVQEWCSMMFTLPLSSPWKVSARAWPCSWWSSISGRLPSFLRSSFTSVFTLYWTCSLTGLSASDCPQLVHDWARPRAHWVWDEDDGGCGQDGVSGSRCRHSSIFQRRLPAVVHRYIRCHGPDARWHSQSKGTAPCQIYLSVRGSVLFFRLVTNWYI